MRKYEFNELLPEDRYDRLTLRLLNWKGDNLLCNVLGFEEFGEYIFPFDVLADSILRRLEVEKKWNGMIVDDDLECLENKIITIMGPLWGIMINNDLMNLEKSNNKENKEEFDFEIKWIKHKLKQRLICQE